MFRVEKVDLFCNPASGGKFSSTAIEIIKRVKKIALAQAKVSHILRPGAWKTKVLEAKAFSAHLRRFFAQGKPLHL
jgi:hypothetical protein